MKHALRLASTLLAAAAITVGCSAKDAPEAPTTITVNFPSTAAAVASDTVQIQVFAATSTTSSDVCQDLVSKVASQQSLPSTLVDSGKVSTCKYLAGTGGTVDVGVGARAFLVTTVNNGSPLLVGCAVEDVAGGELLVPVDLALVSTSSTVPATSCTSVSAFCNGKC